MCAGGLTRKCFNYLQLPDNLIERTYQKVIFQTPFNKTALQFGENFLYTVDRKNLGQWQLEKLCSAENIEIKTGSAVTRFRKDYVVINNSEKINYKYLVGADGSNSIVRKFLGIKTKLTGIAFQYIWPGAPLWDQKSFLIITPLLGIFGIFFFRNFLGTRNHKFIDKAYMYILLPAAVIDIGLALFASPAIAMQSTSIRGIIFTIFNICWS